MPPTPKFDPKLEAGVSGPFGFFDPVGLCPKDKAGFQKFRESELKHGRIAMIAGNLRCHSFTFLLPFFIRYALLIFGLCHRTLSSNVILSVHNR